MKKRNVLAGTLALILAAGFSLSGCGKSAGTQNSETETVTEASAGTATSAQTAVDQTSGTDAESGEKETGLQDGDVIIDLNFDDGETDGFTTYTNGGSFTISNEDGELASDIQSVGSLDYANQMYWDGFALTKGAVYTWSFDIHGTCEREVEARLQLNGGDYHAYTSEDIQVGEDVTHFSQDFEMTESSDPAPRLVFNMGKLEGMDKDTPEHTIYVDNIRLVVKDASHAEVIEALPEAPEVTTSQIGFTPDAEKMVFTKDKDNTKFDVVNADTEETVYSGKFGELLYDVGADSTMKNGDFSALKDAGTYYIRTDGGETTYPFSIGTGLYEDMYRDVVRMLYLQRCGTATDAALAGDFSHPACHTGEATIYGTSEKKDVTGGWHDAGDYGRYVVSGAKAVQDLLLSYEDYQVTTDDLGIPESGNGVPDILDETRVELEWMLKMQDESTGGVYHKVTCANFPETVMPEDETDELILSPVSTAATGDFAAVMTKAAGIYETYDPDFSSKMKEAAGRAWNYVRDLDDTKGFTNPEDIVTGEYPDKITKDEIFWAASELLASGSQDPDARNIVREGLGLSGEESGKVAIRSGLGWADVGTYAFYDLAKAENLTTEEKDIQEAAQKAVKKFADKLVKDSAESGYLQPLEGTYPWGSNMAIADNAMMLRMAARLTEDDDYLTLASQQLDYLCGANPLGYCFVTGFGSVSPEHPHHRPSQALGKAMKGMLVGGADNSLEDPYAEAVLFGQAPAMCYADNQQSYSTNEVTIYWNSPLIYLLSAEK